ncbi:hypothetical protein [Saccharothrix xinjiangensis]|uniref:Uncharacterized protein n=1 Tax=Saccharothrix xinjiangensis TaxID=204798 RepID=A0ABV9XW93_9PSEU
MPEDDHRRAIHATPTSALRAVAVLPAVVLLPGAALAILDELSPPGPPGAATRLHIQLPVRHLVPIDSSPAPGRSRP